jgi:DNA-binding MarR family transcriptional regulator
MILLDLAAFDGRQRYNFVDAIDKTEEDTKKVLARMKALGVVELRKHEYSTRRLWYLTPLGKQLVDNLFDIAQNYIVKQDPIYANTRGNIWNKIRFAARAEKDEYNELREITAKTEV